MALPWSALRLQGPDPVAFLQGLLACDLAHLESNAVQAGCLLTGTGRVQTSLWVHREGDDAVCVLPSTTLESFEKTVHHYGRFNRLTCERLARSFYGGWGPPFKDQALWKLGDACFGYPHQRWISWQNLAPNQAFEAWRRQNLEHLWVDVDASLSGQFSPIELDYLEQGRISVEKGCYLGQEIVARLHFKSEKKTRLRTAVVQGESDTVLAPMVLTSPEHPQETLAVILESLSLGQKRFSVLLLEKKPLSNLENIVGNGHAPFHFVD